MWSQAHVVLSPFSFSIATKSRLALTLANVPFEDVRVSSANWPELKPTLPYGQLPVLLMGDGSPLRAQSGAMLRWIGTDLAPSLYPKDRLYEVEEAMGVVDDLGQALFPTMFLSMFPECYGHPAGWSKTPEGQLGLQKLREKFVQDDLPRFLGYFTTLLEAHDNQWLASTDGPTVADCQAIPLLRAFTRGFLDHVPTDSLETHPAVVDYVRRFCALTPIAGRYSDGLH